MENGEGNHVYWLVSLHVVQQMDHVTPEGQHF